MHVNVSDLIIPLPDFYSHVNRLNETKQKIQTNRSTNISEISVDFIRLIYAAHLVPMPKNSSLATISKARV